MIYDHFREQFVDPYTWIPEQDKHCRLKSILWGMVAAVVVFVISLIILIGIGG
jgi:hypothetical protein